MRLGRPSTWINPVDVRGRRQELLVLGRRSRQVILLAALTGLATGAGVSLFEHLASRQAFERVTEAPLAVQAVAPGIGLVLAALTLRSLAGNATPFAHPAPAQPVLLPGRCKVLLVAGAAAGVAAIFKAPATGAVFALEVPYQDDLARRMLLPALFGAGVSYVTFVSLNATTPLLPIQGAPPFDFRDLGAAVLLGIFGGAGARLFALLVRRAKTVAARVPALPAAVLAGAVLAALAVASHAIYGSALTLGAGYRTVTYAINPSHALTLILSLFVLRAVATAATVAGGGAGGLFIPLVIEGALLGRAAGGMVGEPTARCSPSSASPPSSGPATGCRWRR